MHVAQQDAGSLIMPHDVRLSALVKLEVKRKLYNGLLSASSPEAFTLSTTCHAPNCSKYFSMRALRRCELTCANPVMTLQEPAQRKHLADDQLKTLACHFRQRICSANRCEGIFGSNLLACSTLFVLKAY